MKFITVKLIITIIIYIYYIFYIIYYIYIYILYITYNIYIIYITYIIFMYIFIHNQLEQSIFWFFPNLQLLNKTMKSIKSVYVKTNYKQTTE